MRPQPGQAVTDGVNDRRSNDCNICCAILTSRSREAPGSGVNETLIVSPIPWFNSTASAEVEAIIPLSPMPASVKPRCRGRNRSVAPAIDKP